MLLERLTLTDVGTFSGTQTFDLAPVSDADSIRPIVLFGGLNGAGKTTILASVRLALYGRQSLENATQATYEEFLRSLVHRSSKSLLRNSNAAVILEFTYAKLGEKVRYRIVRTWVVRAKAVDQQLRIYRGQSEDFWIEGEQAQAFLNQLIPSGISQFFFFDGEKIAGLAQDDEDVVLSDAIRRLFGLDLADRLSADLSVYTRQRQAKNLDKKSLAEMLELEERLSILEAEIKNAEEEIFVNNEHVIQYAKAELNRKRNLLMDHGGAWAIDRELVTANLEKFQLRRRHAEDALREQLMGLAIFSAAPMLSRQVSDSLRLDITVSEREIVARGILSHAESLKTTIRDLGASCENVLDCVDRWAKNFSTSNGAETSKFSLTSSSSQSLIVTLDDMMPNARRELRQRYNDVLKLLSDEESLRQQLAMAPSQDFIKEALDALSSSVEEVALLEANKKNAIEEVRRKIWACIDITRKLKRLSQLVSADADADRGDVITGSLQQMIADFKVVAAVEKCKILKNNFLGAFSRLTRKADFISDVIIDPVYFSVTLLDSSGQKILKKQLSAGEKQIYAISMLEALAKTSGRNLPIIIDTPLGRLDSKHRASLVESYFPVASHQVIILSTDTEVDNEFYLNLEKDISHTYHLAFDQNLGCTMVEEGYFWQSSNENWSRNVTE
jgi:DNA sulfur modification protein DndD